MERPPPREQVIAAIHGRTEEEETSGYGLQIKKRRGECLKQVCTIDPGEVRRKLIAEIRPVG